MACGREAKPPRGGARRASACRTDKELARRYALVRQELTETIHLNEMLGIPSPRASEKLFAAIEAEEARAPRRRRISRTPSLATAFSLNK